MASERGKNNDGYSAHPQFGGGSLAASRCNITLDGCIRTAAPWQQEAKLNENHKSEDNKHEERMGETLGPWT